MKNYRKVLIASAISFTTGLFFRKCIIKQKEQKEIYNSRVTCIVGAGAAIDIGGPMTTKLTEDILKLESMKKIKKELDLYYGENKYNFEDLLHLLEQLETYKKRDSAAINKFKPILGAFINVPEILTQEELFIAKNKIYEIIWDNVKKYDDNILIDNTMIWYLDFWRRFEHVSKLDIVTLNYDSSIQTALGKRCTDGYEKNENVGFLRFSSEKLYRDNVSKVLNLHGSIFYGYYNAKKNNEFMYKDSFNDLYKFRNSGVAKENFLNGGRSGNQTQSREVAGITPLITGLKKTEKLLGTPFREYSNYFADSVRKNKSLLIVGYSFSDLHVNSIIERITALHGENRKIVVITFVPESYRTDDKWNKNARAMTSNEGGWISNNEFNFYAKISEDDSEFLGDIDFQYKDYSVSKKGNVVIYFGGFQNAVQNHSENIIKFLTT